MGNDSNQNPHSSPSTRSAPTSAGKQHGSPLRIYTQMTAANRGKSLSPEEASPRTPRETGGAYSATSVTNSLLSSTFTRPYEEDSDKKALLQRVGRNGAHYHPLPSQWRDNEQPGSSDVSSPITPESVGSGGDGGSNRGGEYGSGNGAGPHIVPYTGNSGSIAIPGRQNGGTGSMPVPVAEYHSKSYRRPDSREIQQVKTKAMSPRLQIGALREAFGSTSSLEWSNNDRPGSTYSCNSTEVTGGHGYASESQVDSPLEMNPNGGRFPPALSSMAFRPGGGGVAGGSSGRRASKHHPSASTSSSHYSYAVGSPPLPGGPTTAIRAPSSQLSLSANAATSSNLGVFDDSSISLQGEEIVRKYFGQQQKQKQKQQLRAVSAAGTGLESSDVSSVSTQSQQQQQKLRKPPSQKRLGSPPSQQEPYVQTGTSPDDAVAIASSNAVYRRVLSSGDLPSLDETPEANQNMPAILDNNRFLMAPDMVESPLEALVRRLTIELFQLYVNEDRKKASNKLKQKQPKRQDSSASNDEEDFVFIGNRAPNAQGSEQQTPPSSGSNDEYVQQFRLGPSMRSGSTTPAVTMDGYFLPKSVQSIANAESSNAQSLAQPIPPLSATSAATGGEVRPRPRHRLVQRTWVEEALFKARRVSTIDETAGESILEGLDRMIAESKQPAVTAAQGSTKASSPGVSEDLAQFASAAESSQVSGLGRLIPKKIAPGNLGTLPQPRMGLDTLKEEPSPITGTPDGGQEDVLELPPPTTTTNDNEGHVMSPRGFYRARDPAAPHRKLPSTTSHTETAGSGSRDKKLQLQQQQKQRVPLGISPAKASLLRAVGRRQSVRLQPGKGQILVAETDMSIRNSTIEISPSVTNDGGGSIRDSASSSMLLGLDSSSSRNKRANSLPGLIQVPETREVSYSGLQRKAARQVETKRAPKSRGRAVRRAERMVLGGTQPANTRSADSRHHHQQHSRHHHGGDKKQRQNKHKREISRAELDQQLIITELPPPVPLRVRREQVKMAPEPLIIVRRPANPNQSLANDDIDSAEQEIMRVHNRLLGVQAVLSRHNSVLRKMKSFSGSGSVSGRDTPSASNSQPHPSSTSGGVGSQSKLPISRKAMASKAIQKEALDVVMLDNALEDHMTDDEGELRGADRRHHHHTRDVGGVGSGSTRDREGKGEPKAQPNPWRNARRRSTLRKKEKSKQQQPTGAVASSPSAVANTKAIAPKGRRLLLHGPAYRIYSGLKARPDTYLFLFTDILVVTTHLNQTTASASTYGANTGAVVMIPPSTNANTIPSGNRFKVHIVIPLANSATTMKASREGGSKRPGEDDEAEEKRLVRQEERVRRACHVFERNASEAVVYLINREIIEPIPDTVAGFLYRCTALSRRQLGNFLGAGILGENLHDNPTSDEIEQERQFHHQIWLSLLDRCNIIGVSIDEALRSILFYLRLPNNPTSISVLLEVAALNWYSKNVEYFGQQQTAVSSSDVYLPDSQELAIKLAFAIMTLNTELHNPLLRSETQPEAAYRELVLKFRASVVDDPAMGNKRKGAVLRKRDQPRVVNVMEVPTDILKGIFERVQAKRLVTCSDAKPSAPEFEVDWIRDASDLHSSPLTDDQIEQEMEDVYCDPGFRDGVLFNASSDRLPAKLSVDPPAWMRVTVRIPEPDPKFSIHMRVLSNPSFTATTSDVPQPESGDGGDVVSIAPSNRLNFRSSSTASFIIKPRRIGRFTLHFISEGAHARYFHPIPSRTMVVEGAFMRQTVQLSWNRGGNGQDHRARHMFGMDSQTTKTHWVSCLEMALKNSGTMETKEALRNVEQATNALSTLGSSALSSAAKDATVAMPPSSSSSSGEGISSLQLFNALKY